MSINANAGYACVCCTIVFIIFVMFYLTEPHTNPGPQWGAPRAVVGTTPGGDARAAAAVVGTTSAKCVAPPPVCDAEGAQTDRCVAGAGQHVFTLSSAADDATETLAKSPQFCGISVCTDGAQEGLCVVQPGRHVFGMPPPPEPMPPPPPVNDAAPGSGEGAESLESLESCRRYVIRVGHGKKDGRVLLSCQESGESRATLYTKDDGSGRQRWALVPVQGKKDTYNIRVLEGKPDNKTYLSCGETGRSVHMYIKDDGSGRQRWVVKPVGSAPNTYSIRVAGGKTDDFVYLSCGETGDTVNLHNKDDRSGPQRWVLKGVECDVKRPKKKCTVRLWSESSFKGDDVTIGADVNAFFNPTNVPAKLDGKTSSLEVSDGCQAALHEGPDGTGAAKVAPPGRHDITWLDKNGDPVNDAVRSVRLYEAAGR